MFGFDGPLKLALCTYNKEKRMIVMQCVHLSGLSL